MTNEMGKKALNASTTLHNFLLQFEKSTLEFLDVIRKIRDEILLDLNFKKKSNNIAIFYVKK